MPVPQPAEDTKLKRRRQEFELAKDMLEECRVQLMLKFRFLDLALWRMEFELKNDAFRYPIATTAKKVYIDAPRVLFRYRESFDELVRDYLHCVMHCVFRHPYNEGFPHKEAWWLAADIIVESVIIDMLGGRFPSDDDSARISAINELKMLVGMLVPSKLYTLLRDVMTAPDGVMVRGVDSTKIAYWTTLFERDSHDAWPSNAGEGDVPGEDNSDDDRTSETGDGGLDEPSEGQMEVDGEQLVSEASEEPQQSEQQSRGEKQQSEDSQQNESPQQSEGSQQPEGGNDEEDTTPGEGNPDVQNGQAQTPPEAQAEKPDDRDLSELERDEKDWEEIAKQIEMNLEMFSKEWGEQAVNLVASLEVANRKKYSYADFLRSFMTINEAMKLDMDEFDYIYYTYGIDTYGNMPLIEPLEYKDTHQIRDFVIAVDTSESTSGELVRRFLEHTFEILKESENFTREVNIHILQCDNHIRSDIKITNVNQVPKIMEDFHIRGFGGTDFRPVFDYVDHLRHNGELRDIKGLIYFTDGLGRFPEKAPDYETAFVFLSDGERTLPSVPPWAIKVIIDEHAINRMRTSTTIKRRKKRLLDAEEEG